jgi:hypothetical protein
MELVVDRKWKKQGYTISNLTIDGKWFCNILEDTDRGLDDSMSIAEIRKLKKPSITAIPRGTYEVTLDVISPRFCTKPFYKQVCNSKLPRLLNVKGFEGILIHAGNTDKDSAGCLLVGLNTVKGKVTSSQDTFTKLYKALKEGRDRGEKITIKIL